MNTKPDRSGNWTRILRGFRRFVTAVLGLAFIVVAWLFTLENRESVVVRFGNWMIHLPIALALFTTFLAGSLMTLLVVVPRWLGWRLRYHLLRHRHERSLRRPDEPNRRETDP